MNKVLMIVYSYLPQDPRVRREASALIENGYQVDIICLRDQNQSAYEKLEKINIFRLNLKKSRSTKRRYIILYISFFIRAFFKTNILWLKNKYSVIHVHNMPDFLIFIPFIQKLFGAKLILDLHDPTPEVFMTKFNSNTKTIDILKFQEKISIAFANKIITTNLAFVDSFLGRGCPKEKVNIVMNSPDEKVFAETKSLNLHDEVLGKYILMYHGVIVERHGLDSAVRAVNILKDKIPFLEFWVFGEGEFKDIFLSEVKKFKLENYIKYKGNVSLEKIAATIPYISLGVIPNKISPFTNINFPTRIFEYLYFKKPVIVPKTKGISDYFRNDEIFYFNPEKEDNLAEAIYSVYIDQANREKIINKSYMVYKEFTWENQKNNLLEVYNSLLKN